MMSRFGGKRADRPTNTSTSVGTGVKKLTGALPFLLLGLAAWAVALAGVAVMRHEVGEDVLGSSLSFTWWVVFFSLFVLLTALIHAAGHALTGKIPGLRSFTIGPAAITGLLAVVTALTMLETQRWYNARSVTDRSDRLGKGVRTAFAGFLALSALNLILILILGNDDHSHNRVVHTNAVSNQGLHPHQTVETQPTHTAYTHAPAHQQVV